MQPDLPWNIAGIPPEAREAVRAAARREGLSVGEWLTRRILKGMVEAHEGNGRSRAETEDRWNNPSRDTEEMLARVSRSERESFNANRKIEDQLRALGRRLEAAERSQLENSRTMNKAATEINVAAREQAQAVDQLSTHVVDLADRLSKVEQAAGMDHVKDAVKGLHAGLSRLADQLAQTANQSASQVANLADSVESLAEKLVEARNDADSGIRAFAARIAAFEDRLRSAEFGTRSAAEKLERMTVAHEAARQDSPAVREEFDRQALRVQEIRDGLDELSTRITINEAQNAGAIARIEDRIAKVEARHDDLPLDRRLQGIEHTLSDIAGRLEGAERNFSSAAKMADENFRALTARLDGGEQFRRDAAGGIHAPADTATPDVPTPPPTPVAPAPVFDLPPFPQTPPSQEEASSEAQTSVQPSPPEFSPLPPAQKPVAQDLGTPNASASYGPAVEPPEPHESYLAAARRSARMAAEAEAQSGPRMTLGGFTWGQDPLHLHQTSEKPGGTRFVLVAGIFVIAVGAIVSGILLSRGLLASSGSAQTATAPAATSTPNRATPGTGAKTNMSVPSQSAAAVAPVPPTVRSLPRGAAVPIGDGEAPALAAKPERADIKRAQAAPSAALVQRESPTGVPSPAKDTSPFDRLMTLATAGSSKAELLVGLRYLEGDGVVVNEAEAAKWLDRAAKQGEAVAAYRLGTLYERGHGVPADAAKAAQWYAAAAKLGNRKAMHNLAVAFAEGSGVPKDLTQAAQWFSKAAAFGLADSEFNLAVLYERGMGVQQSLIDAFKWYAIAAAQGDAESKARLDVISTQLNADERAAAQKAASDFRPLQLDRNANIPPDASMLD